MTLTYKYNSKYLKTLPENGIGLYKKSGSGS